MSDQNRFQANYRRKSDASRVRFALRHAGGMGRYLAQAPGAGKTAFLQQELLPVLRDDPGIIVVLAALSLKPDSPQDVVINAMQEALELEYKRLGQRAKRLAATKVKTVSTPVFGVTFDTDGSVVDAKSPAPEIQLHKLANSLAQLAGEDRLVLLCIDDAGELLSPRNRQFATALRSVIDAHSSMKGFFLLDSDVAAKSLFVRPGAPMQGVARAVQVQPVGDDFYVFMCAEYQRQCRVRLDDAQMRLAWERLGRNPKYFRGLLEDMALDRAVRPDGYMEPILAEYHASDDWSEFHDGHPPLSRAVLLAVSAGKDLRAAETLQEIGEVAETKTPTRARVDKAIKHLVDDGVLSREAQGPQFVSAEYQAWLRNRSAPQLGRHCQGSGMPLGVGPQYV